MTNSLTSEQADILNGILAETIKANNVTLARKCLHKGADINASHKSWTPLCLAIEMYKSNPETDIIEMLLQEGVDPNIPHSSGKTPLRLVVEATSIILVKLLIKNGADPLLTGDPDTLPALAVARASYATRGMPEIIDVLLDGLEDKKTSAKAFNLAATVSDGTSSNITVSRLTPHKKPSTDPLKP